VINISTCRWKDPDFFFTNDLNKGSKLSLREARGLGKLLKTEIRSSVPAYLKTTENANILDYAKFIIKDDELRGYKEACSIFYIANYFLEANYKRDQFGKFLEDRLDESMTKVRHLGAFSKTRGLLNEVESSLKSGRDTSKNSTPTPIQKKYGQLFIDLEQVC